MKRQLLLILTALLPLLASAYDAEIDGIYYNFSGDKATVTYQKYENYDYTSDYSGDVVIPSSVTYNGTTYSVTSIGEYAFWGCSSLTSVTIPNSVTSIGKGAFSDCYWLTSIIIPCSVTSIGSIAFGGCRGLTSIKIPGSVTNIASQTFYGCDGLTSITFEDGVTSIGEQAFGGCTSLTSVMIPSSVVSIGDEVFKYCYNLSSVTIPSSVTSIGERPFCCCTSLSSINVEAGNIKYDSRDNCNAIIETESNTLIAGCPNTMIPNNVTSIGEFAFYSCTELTSITIPDSVTSIGKCAFSECSGLTSITIPGSVTSIGYYAFDKCGGLTSITIPCSVTSLGDGAFANCYGLISVTIPGSVTSLGYGIFSYCSGLISVKIEDGVKSIGNYVFESCSSLTSVMIPGSVMGIEGYAFFGCSGLKDVYCYAENVPQTNSDAFNDSPISSATLHVPAGSVEAYNTTMPWSGFGTIVATYNGKCATPAISYANGKLTFNCDTEGATCKYTITDTDIKSGSGNEVQLGVTYTINVYATKEDYEDSEVATGTLCWIDQQPSTEGIVAEDAVTEVKALPVLIQSNGGTITIQGANEGTEISVYSVNGMKQGSAIATNGFATINTSLQPGSTAIVKIGEKAIKVLIK